MCKQRRLLKETFVISLYAASHYYMVRIRNMLIFRSNDVNRLSLRGCQQMRN